MDASIGRVTNPPTLDRMEYVSGISRVNFIVREELKLNQRSSGQMELKCGFSRINTIERVVNRRSFDRED